VTIHTADPFAPEPSYFEVQTVVGKTKTFHLPGINQIPEKLIPARGETLRSEVHKLINSVWNEEDLSER
jgi:hypothetical protein